MDKGLPAILIQRPYRGRAAVRWAGLIPLDETWAGSDVEFADQPTAEVNATESENGGVHVTGKVLVALRVRCRRCLVRQSSSLRVVIDVRFEPDIDPWDEAQGLYRLDDTLERIDILPALHEELLVALPGYPLCRQDCKGLCAVCGTDLNAGICDCRIETTDPRWEALSKVSESNSDADDDDENQEG